VPVAGMLHRVAQSARLSNTVDSPQPMEDSSLLAAPESGISAQSRTWEWLAALRQPLNADVQLVDANVVAGVIPGAARGPADLSRLIDARSPLLRAAVSTTIRTDEPQSASIDGVHIIASSIKVGMNVSKETNGVWSNTWRTCTGAPPSIRCKSATQASALCDAGPKSYGTRI